MKKYYSFLSFFKKYDKIIKNLFFYNFIMNLDKIILQKKIISILKKSEFNHLEEFLKNIEIYETVELKYILNFLESWDCNFVLEFLLQKQKEIIILKWNIQISKNIKKIKDIKKQELEDKKENNLEINI